MLIRYSSNNSGGSWWLTDEDWHKLEFSWGEGESYDYASGREVLEHLDRGEDD